MSAPVKQFPQSEIPGIQDIVFDTKAGTFYSYVYAIAPLAPASLLATVQEALNQNTAFPLTGTALNPDLAGISLAATITLVSGATSTDQQTAITSALQAVADYINNLRVGQQLVINDISDRILNSRFNLLRKYQEYRQYTRVFAARAQWSTRVYHP